MDQISLRLSAMEPLYTMGSEIWVKLTIQNNINRSCEVVHPFYNSKGNSPYQFKIYETSGMLSTPIIQSTTLPNAKGDTERFVTIKPNDSISFLFCINPSAKIPEFQKIWLDKPLYFGKYRMMAIYNPQGILKNDPYIYLHDTETEVKPNENYMYGGGHGSNFTQLKIQNNTLHSFNFQEVNYIKDGGNHRYGIFNKDKNCFAGSCITNDSLDVFILVYSNHLSNRCGDLDFKLSYHANGKVESILYYKPDKCKGTTASCSFDTLGRKISETIEVDPTFSIHNIYKDGVISQSFHIRILEEKATAITFSKPGHSTTKEIDWPCKVVLEERTK